MYQRCIKEKKQKAFSLRKSGAKSKPRFAFSTSSFLCLLSFPVCMCWLHESESMHACMLSFEFVSSCVFACVCISDFY